MNLIRTLIKKNSAPDLAKPERLQLHQKNYYKILSAKTTQNDLSIK